MPRFPILDKGTAYVGTSLFLPKDKLAAAPIERALTFGIDPTEPPRVLVEHHVHHMEVPRNFRTVQELEKRGIPVVDLRAKVFAKISLTPKKGFALRPYQVAAWTAMQSALDRGEDFILRLDTGRGKTIMGWYAAAYLHVPTLVISAQEAHLNNWENELHSLFDLQGKVGRISGKKLEWEADIVLCTVQTLVKRAEDGKLPRDFSRRFGLTIFDEVHHQAAKWFSKASDLLVGRRMGLTATLRRKDRCEGVITAHLGRVVYDDPAEDTLTPTIHVHTSSVEFVDTSDPRILDRMGQPNVSRMRSFLAEHEHRNDLIVRTAQRRLKEGRKVYILSHSKQHVYTLADMLRSSGAVPGVITGDDKKASNRLEQLNNYDVVIATVHVGKEAYNRPELSALILATPMGVDFYAPTEFVQSTGRILRPHPGKPKPVVDLIADTGVEPSLRMLKAMLRWCHANNWPVTNDKWTRSAATGNARIRRSAFHSN